MGFLKVLGEVLEWEESKKHFKRIRENGKEQIIRILKKEPANCKECYFGFEVGF